MTENVTEVWLVQDQHNQVVSWDHSQDESRLYYEAHVTIPPLDNAQIEQVDQLCQRMDWRRSTFELHKGGLTPNAFVSCRDKSRAAIVARTAEMVSALVRQGHTVLRYKVEDTLLDSNKGDHLLPPGSTLSPPVPREGIYTEPSHLGPVTELDSGEGVAS